MGIYENLSEINKRYPLYKVKCELYPKDRVPFKVSPEPLFVTPEQQKEINIIGTTLSNYFNAVQHLYYENDEFRRILNVGKSTFFEEEQADYIFIRPDLIMTESGFKICEIETSIFGLGLSDVLNRTYSDEFNVLSEKHVLEEYSKKFLPQEGVMLYTENGEHFEGQLQYLTNEIFPKNWNISKVAPNNLTQIQTENVYRAFYSNELFGDMENANIVIPSLTPQFEGKDILSLIWDKRFFGYFRDYLGTVSVTILRRVIPETVVVGQEEYCDFDIPSDMAQVSKGKRKWVLKESLDSSWCQGIYFLHKLSHERVQNLMNSLDITKKNYVLQKFYPGKKVSMKYYDSDMNLQSMDGRVRITPYYAIKGINRGQLLSIKATICSGTERIHGTTDCINTAVAVQ